jgi:hypothetical protein
MKKGKIFGIGLSRTGTSSLAVALGALGYRSVHWPHDCITREQLLRHYRRNNKALRLTVVDTNDCVTDTPIASVYRELDKQYPDSRFILTLRNQPEWLDACERFWKVVIAKVYRESDPHYVRYVRAVNRRVYGQFDFNRDEFSLAYDKHVENVMSWFRAERDRLLIINICAGDKWDKVCQFVGRPVPKDQFPHFNKAGMVGKRE